MNLHIGLAEGHIVGVRIAEMLTREKTGQGRSWE